MVPNNQEEKINDSLYELSARRDQEPDIDIIFFHGLQVNLPFVGTKHSDAYKSSWACMSDPSVCWLQQWLGPDLLQEGTRARVFSISYDSSAFQTSTSGRADLHLISENLMNDIVFFRRSRLRGYRIGENWPVVLVGHSLGGLVLKHFVIEAQKRKDWLQRDPSAGANLQTVTDFLSNIRGVFYYSTPHNGAALAELMQFWPGKTSPVVQFLRVLSKDSARLNSDFSTWRRLAAVQAWTLFEQNKTSFLGFHKLVVKEGSARYDSDNVRSAAADHFSICKPKFKRDVQYEWLVQFLEVILASWATRKSGPAHDVRTHD
ncbi:hypothetical protein AXG93_2587s1790 [Marchantia polymorpha subsp. ruderalis]|nr:hypothetical protein AXG93_2587s1790 [Marchantia polymorpha subsp. ruderalis]